MGTRRRNSSECAQHLGHAPPGELAVGQLADVVVGALAVGLAVEDHVEGHAHRLLRRQVAEGDGRHEAVEDPIGASLPPLAWHRPILSGADTSLGPGREALRTSRPREESGTVRRLRLPL